MSPLACPLFVPPSITAPRSILLAGEWPMPRVCAPPFDWPLNWRGSALPLLHRNTHPFGEPLRQPILGKIFSSLLCTFPPFRGKVLECDSLSPGSPHTPDHRQLVTGNRLAGEGRRHGINRFGGLSTENLLKALRLEDRQGLPPTSIPPRGSPDA